ncbi:MAG TPA: PrgI family protein [Candidatus Moranbacteria bacterium]|nr:PrgI family protein [Candidatus Moranbacteria bacterium]
MIFGVPQYVDIEDRIAFRLTAKQLGWFGLAGLIMFGFWYFFEFWVFVVASIICITAATSFAFFRPAGLSLAAFIGRGVAFLTSRKILWWDKGVDLDESRVLEKKNKESSTARIQSRVGIQEKRKTVSELEYIAQALDRKSDL